MSVTETDRPQTPSSAQVLGGLTAYLTMSDARAASAFYQRALGAKEISCMPPPGGDSSKVIHCHLHINGASLFLSDGFPEHGHPATPHQGYGLVLNLDDIDAWWKRAVDNGMEVVMPLQLMFWGDRYGQLRDPFGVSWSMNQPATN